MSEPDAAVVSEPIPRPRRVASFLGGLLTVGLVLAIGLLAGLRVGRKAGGGGSEGHETHEEHEEHESHAAEISPQTLQNLGVEFGALKADDFVRTREIAAVVESRPDAHRSVYAPIGGRVVRVRVRPGQIVRAGDPLAEIARDAFPRPVLTLTDGVLRPLNEDFHRSIGDLRSFAQSLALAREELARVRRILGTPEGSSALPTKTEIDLSYEERRSLRSLESARIEAHRHGLGDEEIAAIEAGGAGPGDLPPARRILERNRLWSSEASEIAEALPDAVRALPYTVALLGELAGAHALTPELVALVKSRPALAKAFLDVAGLVQQGETPARLAALADAGALESTFTLLAPDDAPDWDVVLALVRDGAHVETGATVVELSDDRLVALRATPAGSDVLLLETALRRGTVLSAVPAADGAGPSLSGLRVYRMDESAEGTTGVFALILAKNTVLRETTAEGAPTTRTWTLRPGMRHLLRVPMQTLSGRFVVPADAVVPRGPDSVVVLKDGTGFRLVPVHVEYADARTAVLENAGVFPGDVIALKSAYALSLALQAGASGGESGHHHHH